MDWLTPRQRSHNMASIRSKGNATTEGIFLAILREAGISGWRRHLNLPGKPDFVFQTQKLVVFLDGCFWHGCPHCYRLPQDNRPYWKKKVLGNRRRDRRCSRELRAKGWHVMRVWEHWLKTPLNRTRVLARLCRTLNATAPHQK